MSMKTETEIGLELELLFGERTEDPCEHSEHGTLYQAHSGPGEWLIVYAHCGEARHLLVCDTFVQVIRSDRLVVHCSGCGADGLLPGNVYTILGRKGVDF